LAIPTTNENIDIEQTFVGDVTKPLDGSEFNNTDPIINKLRLMPNNQFSLPVNQDDEFIQVAKYSGISSVITDFVTPVLTYPLRKIEDILTKSDTTFGKSIRRENELKKAETFVGPKVVGTEVKTPSFEPTNSASYFTRTNDTVDLNLSQIIPTKGADNKGIPVAKNLMNEARDGKRGKRGPLSVIDNGDGTYKLMDGNATFFAAKDMNLENLPVRVLTEEQYAKEASALKIRKAQEKENAAKFKANVKPVKLEDGLLSDFRAVGAGGDAKIPDEGNILATIESVSLTFKDKITEANRGSITQAATIALADDLGVNPKTLTENILGRKRGGIITSDGAGLAETMLASRELLVAEVKKLDGLAQKAETGSNQDALDFRVQLELVGNLQSQIKGAQTEIARALGQFKIPVRGADFDQTKAQNIDSVLESFGGGNDIREMAKLYNNVGESQGAKLAFTNKGTKLQKFGNALYESWINILLSSGITHMKNTTGNILTTLAHVGETYVAGGIGSVKRSMGGEGGVYIGEGNAQLFAGLMVLREAMGAAGTAFKTGETPIVGSKLQGSGGKRFGNDFSAEGFEATGLLGNVADIVGNFMTLGRVPTKMLEFEDTFFKVMASRMSLYQQAYRSGKTKGLNGDDLSNHIGEYVYNPPDIAIKEANSHAKYVTLQNELDSVGKGINAIRKVPGMRYFLPFFKTPYNAFKYAAIDRGPIGFFFGETKAAIDAAKKPGASAADKAAGQMAQAKLYLGNATGGAVFMMASNGEITGGGPTDPDLRNALRRSGWQPYSVKVGDTYYSYAAAEPFSSILGMASDVAEAMQSGDVDEASGEAIMASLQAALGNQITNKTFMQGFSTLMKALQDPGRYGKGTVDNFWRSIVPRVLAQGEKNVDPLVRATYSKLDQLKAQIPFLSSDLMPRRNFWGQKIMLSGAYGPDIISPIYSSTIGPNNAVTESNELVGEGVTQEDYAKRAYEVDQEFIALRFGPSKHHETWDANVGLTPKEIDKLHQYSGLRSLEQAERIMEMSEYKNLKEAWLVAGDKLAREAAETMLNGAIVTARAMAKKDLLDDDEFGDGLKDRMEESFNLQKKKYEKVKGIMR
tara:strand:- start:268 stop:3549 length:3282 start_codon:yes stop_codon:yes gene_type:complete